MRAIVAIFAIGLAGGLAAVRAELPRPETFDETGFVKIFDGKTLKGWKVSPKTGHSRASKNKSGGKWVAQDGAIVGSQDIPGNGGIIITEKEYGDFEVVLEMNNDFGPDSGLFLRSTDTGKCYQAMVDYHAAGNLMGIYGGGPAGRQAERAELQLQGQGDRHRLEGVQAIPLPGLGRRTGPRSGRPASGTNSARASRGTRPS